MGRISFGGKKKRVPGKNDNPEWYVWRQVKSRSQGKVPANQPISGPYHPPLQSMQTKSPSTSMVGSPQKGHSGPSVLSSA